MSQKNREHSKFQPLLAPSLLSANFAHLEREIKEVENGGADWLHIDVMDGHFVPNLTFGPLIVEAIRPLTQLQLDCHLMVSDPEKWVKPFAKAGAHIITVHAEASPHLNRLVHLIQSEGCKAGVSVNPGTSLSVLDEILDSIDLVLIMSVNPGFGGQKFIEKSVEKIEKLVQMRGNSSFLIEVDGGVNSHNIKKLRKAGADVFVAGSAVFAKADRRAAISELKNEMQGE